MRKRRPGRKFLDPELLARAARYVQGFADQHGIRVALVGGLAMQFYGSTRLTGDVNFVAESAMPIGEDVQTLSFGGKRYLVLDAVPVDLIVRRDEFKGLYEAALSEAESTDEGFWVVSPEYLAAMKYATGRAKDRIDLLWLLIQRGLVDTVKSENIIRRHLGGSIVVRDFRQLTYEARWRAGEFDEGEIETREEE